jgi:hypothetical protein
MNENASLLVCNLVAQGKTLAEARKIAGENNDGQAGERSAATFGPSGSTGSGSDPRMPKGKEALQTALKERNIPFHPKLGEDKLKALYQAEVLDKLPKEEANPENPENPEAPAGGNDPANPYGAGSEPGDGN